MPLISVIVPVYNTCRFIDRCITSILDQSLSDFEVIFVDDGSSDHSAQVVRQFARNDPRIILHKHGSNLGPGAARNTGIAKARAKQLAFIDSDDFVDPNLLERLFEAADGGRFDIVESGCRWINENEDVLSEYTPHAAKVTTLGAVPDSIFLMQEWGMHQKLWKKSLFTENGIRFPEHVFWEDIAVFPSLVISADSLAKIDFIGYNYLQRTESITNTRSLKHILDLFKALEYIKSFLNKRGIYKKYEGSFKKAINNTVSYFLEHMRLRNRANPERSDRLIRIFSILTDEYLAGGDFIDRLPLAQLELAIDSAPGDAEFEFASADAKLVSLINRILETVHAD